MTDDQLVDENLGLMKWAIRHAAPGRDVGEFLGIAYEAIRQCRPRHDPARAPWSSFAIRCVVNAVITELRRENRRSRGSVPMGDRDHRCRLETPPDRVGAREDGRLLAEAVLRVGEDRGLRHGHVAALMARGVGLRQMGPIAGVSSSSSLCKLSELCLDDLTDFLGSERAERIDRRKGTRFKGPGPATSRRPKCKIVR